MTCRSCGLQGLRKFPAEIAIHFPRLDDIAEPHVFLFPTLLVCPHCGAAEFTVPDAELRPLVKDDGGGKV